MGLIGNSEAELMGPLLLAVLRVKYSGYRSADQEKVQFTSPSVEFSKSVCTSQMEIGGFECCVILFLLQFIIFKSECLASCVLLLDN